MRFSILYLLVPFLIKILSQALSLVLGTMLLQSCNFLGDGVIEASSVIIFDVNFQFLI